MNVETARRIVALNLQLLRPMSAGLRNRMLAEQRSLWNAQFPGLGYEQIAATAH